MPNDLSHPPLLSRIADPRSGMIVDRDWMRWFTELTQAINEGDIGALGALPAHAARHKHGGADEVASEISGPFLIPKANSVGKFHASWIANHGSLHRHGGGDEVATAVAAANAIPKAGAGGTLSLPWVDEVIPLNSLSDVTITTPVKGHELYYTGSLWRNEPRLLDVNATEVNVVNTTTETSIYSFSVPANSLAAGRRLHCRVEAFYTNTSTTFDSISVKVTFGGVTLVSGQVGGTFANSGANKRIFQLDASIAAVGASDQRALLDIFVGNQDVASAAWAGTDPDQSRAWKLLTTLDLTTALTFEVLITHGFADPGASFKKHLGVVEVHS